MFLSLSTMKCACVGNTIDQVKNGASTQFLQIREGLGANRPLKPKPKKKKKGDARQCQTGMDSTRLTLSGSHQRL